MGHLLRRARRVLKGKLAGLLEREPSGPGGGFGPVVEGEAGPEGASASSGEPVAGSAASESCARACAILEVGRDATPDELRSAYRRLCRRYHPDRFAHDADKSGAANELLAEVNAAYELLTDVLEAR